MEKIFREMHEVFLDTSFAIALSAITDQMFRSRQDKEWGLVDCVSFVVMQNRGIAEALTADEHFHQAGFRSLLRT
jgi:predicted nucleic acid-binding protein